MLKKFFCAFLLLALASVTAVAQVPAVCDPSNGSYNPGNASLRMMIAGSSAMWVSMALGAYNVGNGPVGAVNGTQHYVGASKFTYSDTRLTQVFGTAPSNTVTDTGSIWIVWDNNVTSVGGNPTCTPNVWAYISLDSVVGNRAFFSQGINASVDPGTGNPTNAAASVVFSPSPWPAGGGTLNAVLGAFWGDASVDSTVPANVQQLFNSGNATGGALINVGATDIRPEDAFWASNRVNSQYTTSTGWMGLGYNSANAPGALPVASCTTAPPYHQTGGSTAPFQGADIYGDYNGDSAFHVVSFNVQGQDPITCAPIPNWSVLSVGASPIVFFYSYSKGVLSNLTNASELQLEQVFSANKSTAFPNASMLGLSAGTIAAFLREPLSGTMNTTELSVFLHPSRYNLYRYSQEAGINGALTNPAGGSSPSAKGTYVLGPGNRGRWRAIGTGDEVKSVRDSGTKQNLDGIGYAFFSYGNLQPINTGSYHYITLNGIDPIWHNYVNGTNGFTDPGQSNTPGTIPSPATLPASCAGGAGAFPCDEGSIWGKDPIFTTRGLSFPNLRHGSYPAWSVLRLVVPAASVNPTVYSDAQNLISSSNTFVVTVTPDYVPFDPVTSGATKLDPGLQVLRSHYGCIPQTCNSVSFATGGPVTTVHPVYNGVLGGLQEQGRDAGGSILGNPDSRTSYVSDGFGGFAYFSY